MAMSQEEEYALVKLVFDIASHPMTHHGSYKEDLKVLKKYLKNERGRAEERGQA